jgi:hypothetical protein
MNALQRRGIARGLNPGIGRFVSDLNDNRRKVYPRLFPCDLSLPETERASIAGLVRAYSDDESPKLLIFATTITSAAKQPASSAQFLLIAGEHVYRNYPNSIIQYEAKATL